MARDQPTVMLIDDIHWAEETFLELLTYLVDAVQAPLIMVCSSRPELLEEHAEWVQETDTNHRIVLQPLSETESAQVAQNLLGRPWTRRSGPGSSRLPRATLCSSSRCSPC